uniref:mannose-1-phosphate guanyltransferase alpha-A-like n=1 Tax=Styela clava TaxID=7725 RepID=UPI00193AA089|nr:mannose-1-phosphate guanyltransferase alpha-A-like [Styela clava]
MWKAVILIGGPDKGTRFRPLSLNQPKPLFPVAGVPMIQHHIEACVAVPNLQEIILIGFFPEDENLKNFINHCRKEFNISIRYLREFSQMGTGGGLYHFRDQIMAGNPSGIFVMNSDVCCNFPLSEMLQFHLKYASPSNGSTILATNVPSKESMFYGCLVENEETKEVTHYVEKPESFVSPLINCGVYLFSTKIFGMLAEAVLRNQEEMYAQGVFSDSLSLSLEQDIIMPLTDLGSLYAYQTTSMWSQIKSAASAVYANKLYLSLYHETHPHRLAKSEEGGPMIIGDVFIHPSAKIDPTALLGPNVTICADVRISAGVRVRNSIILNEVNLSNHSCVLNSIIGWKSTIGEWTRVEGTAQQPDPNAPFAKIVSGSLFDHEGKLSPSITVLGGNVNVESEIVVLNAIVLPGKDLKSCTKNQIIL